MAPVSDIVADLNQSDVIHNVTRTVTRVVTKCMNVTIQQDLDTGQLKNESGAGNFTHLNSTSHGEELKKLNEFHIIKAIVLTVVTIVILLSICKMVFGMILKYPGKTEH